MSNFRRRLLLGQTELPVGYTRYDWIQPQGTGAAISLPFTYDWDNKYELYHTVRGVNSTSGWFGVNGQLQLPLTLFGNDTNKSVMKVLAVANGECYTYKNDVLVQTLTFGSSYGEGFNYKHFTLGGHTGSSYYKLYNSVCYVDDVLVCNIVPCVENSSNRVGVFDLVSRTMIYNTGNVTLLYGNDN